MRQSPRERRLAADHQSLSQLQAESSIFSFHARGTLPERYEIRFRGLGLWRLPDGDVVVRDEHELRIELGAAYPRMMPSLGWQTPIFHPNISTSGVVCLGGYGTHWVPSLKLDELCHMLWDMIRMKNFDIKSPYNREAAYWVHCQTRYRFPLDGRALRDRVSGDELPARSAISVYNVVPPPVQTNPKRGAVLPRIVESLARFGRPHAVQPSSSPLVAPPPRSAPAPSPAPRNDEIIFIE